MSDLQIRVKAVDASGKITDFEVLSGVVESVGYDSYNSGIVKFVDKDTLEEITDNVITEEFQGTIQLNAAGSITGVTVTNPGAGYQVGTQATILGAIDRATAVPVISNFRLTDVTLTKTGKNYRATDTQVKFVNPSNGQEIELGQAQLTPVFDPTDSTLIGIAVANGGAGYPSTATLRITNTRQQALATAVVTAGVLTNVTVTQTGTGYKPALAQIKFIDPATGAQITPLQFPVTNLVIDSVGNLTGVNIVQGGSGLPPAVNVEILFNDPAVTATASLQINGQGTITAASVASAGSGLRAATTLIEIINTSGQVIQRQKAAFTANIDTNGDLVGFTKVTEGIGYPADTQVLITDNFTSASLTAQVNSTGGITGFTVNAAGSGYRSPVLQLKSSTGSTYLIKAVATAIFEDGVLTGIEVLEPGSGYDPVKTAAIIVDESAQSCPDGVESQNLWLNALGPEVYALAVEALTPQDPTFVRQEPIYDYCGRLIGYEEVVVSGDRVAEGGNPLDGAVTEPLDLNHEFVWINAPAENRVGWGVTGRTSEQLVGAPGDQRLTEALDLNPEVVLYRGQSHVFSIPSGLSQEFYIYETIEDPNGRAVTLANGTTIKIRPDTTRKFSQGLHRFETGEYLDEANGRDENAEVWSGRDLEGNPTPEPAVWRRQDLHPEGSTLLFQIGEGDTEILQKHWPDFLAYSDASGQNFGIFRLI